MLWEQKNVENNRRLEKKIDRKLKVKEQEVLKKQEIKIFLHLLLAQAVPCSNGVYGGGELSSCRWEVVRIASSYFGGEYI